MSPSKPGHDDVQLLLRSLINLGGSAGNLALRNDLGWTEARYWRAHGRAVDDGNVIRGRGQGGSVRITEMPFPESDLHAINSAEVSIIASAEGTAGLPPRIKESELYPAALKSITDGWSTQENYDESICEITALRGSAKTGGKWSRPDVSVLGIKTYPYLPGKVFEVVTFEIKPKDRVDVEGVFEALSHQQFSNRSFVVYDIGNADRQELSTSRLVEIARLHGVGVIFAENIVSWSTWEVVVPARRGLPDPEQANLFIATGFSDKAKDRVVRWHK